MCIDIWELFPPGLSKPLQCKWGTLWRVLIVQKSCTFFFFSPQSGSKTNPLPLWEHPYTQTLPQTGSSAFKFPVINTTLLPIVPFLLQLRCIYNSWTRRVTGLNCPNVPFPLSQAYSHRYKLMGCYVPEVRGEKV